MSSADRQESGFLRQDAWQSILDAIHAATGWSVLLFDEEARVLCSAGESPALLHLDAGFASLVRATAGEGVLRLVRRQAPGGEQPWLVRPVSFAPAGWAIVAGGHRLIPALGAPGAEGDVAAAGQVLDGILGSFAALLSAEQKSSEEARLRYEAERRRSAALYEVSTLINSVHDTRGIVAAVLRETMRLFEADRGAVLLAGDDGQLSCVEALDFSAAFTAAVAGLFDAAHPHADTGLLRPLYLHLPEMEEAAASLREPAARERIQSLILAPFVYRGSLLGVMVLGHEQRRAYSADDAGAMILFANQVAVALTNARLFERSERQLRRSVFLSELGRLLSASLDQAQVQQSLVSTATRVLGEACAIYLLRKPDARLLLGACYDTRLGSGERLQAILDREDLPLETQPAGMAALARKWLQRSRVAPDDADTLLERPRAHSYLSVPLLAHGDLLGVLVFWLFDPARSFGADDVTLAEAIADRAAAALQNARLYETELRAQEFKDEFLSSVSHELRTPLTAILGYSQLIRKTWTGSDQRLSKQMDIIWSQAQRLNRLVETVLDISSIQHGDLALNREPLDLREMLAGAVERARLAAPRETLFKLESGSEPLPMPADRLRLEQVFGHLLSNAVKYTPAGGTITVSASAHQGLAVVEIADHGPGIDEGELRHLFNRYYKGESPMSRAGGLGLGLYVTRGIVEAHGGTISARSEPGSGAVFRVELPLAPAVQQ